MISTLRQLCSVNGTSGREEKVRECIISLLDKSAEYSVDKLGNLIVFKKGRRTPKNKIMLCAHMDEVGFIINYITDDGFLRFTNVGGIDISVCCGRNVLVGKDLIPGVIGVKPVHLLSADDEKKYPEKDSLYIDIGASSREDAEKTVRLGDCAYFDSDFVLFGDGKIKGRAIDDRAGCAIMLEMLRSEIEFDAWFVFSVQEETGAGGVQTAAFAIEPDYALVLEATTAADIAGVEGEKRVCALGEGAVISFMDRRTAYSTELYSAALDLAKANGIKAQPKTLVAGGNDAGTLFKCRDGVKVLAVSLPCRYLHSPCCVIDKGDLDDTLKLVYLLAEDFACR